MSVLERCLREHGRRGIRAAVVAGAPHPLAPDLGVEVTWVEPGTPAPEGLAAVRGDECAGIPIVDEASARRAEWALCRSLSKSHQGLTDALVNRHISIRITRLLGRTSIRPNTVTLLAGAVGLAAAAALLSAKGWAAVALGGVLFQVQSILDSCDGELARLTWRFSRFGQWLDNLSDDVLDNLFIVSAGVAAGGPWLLLGVAGAAARLGTVAIAYVEVYRATGTGDLYKFRFWFEQDKETIDEVYDPRSPLTYVRALARRDTFVFLWMLACLAGLPQAVAVYGAGLGAVQLVLGAFHVALRRPAATPERAS